MKEHKPIRGIQYGYSEKFSKYMYDEPSRKDKALRTIAIFEANRSNQNCLEVGSAIGIMPYYLADYFTEVVGIDIDKQALDYAQNNYSKPNLYI